MTHTTHSAAGAGSGELAEVELVDDAAEFFAPVSSDVVDGLIGQYRSMRAKVERVAGVMTSPDLDGAFHYFAEALDVAIEKSQAFSANGGPSSSMSSKPVAGRGAGA